MEEYRDLELTLAAFHAGVGRAGVRDRSRPGSCCRRTCPTRGRPKQRLTDWAKRRVAAGGSPRSSCGSSKGPTWRWRPSRPNCTAGTRPRTPPRPTPTPTTAGCSNSAASPTTPPPSGWGSPATICSTSRWPWCCGKSLGVSNRRSSWKCWKGWPTTRPARSRHEAGGPAGVRPGGQAGRLHQRAGVPGSPPGREHVAGKFPARPVRPEARARPAWARQQQRFVTGWENRSDRADRIPKGPTASRSPDRRVVRRIPPTPTGPSPAARQSLTASAAEAWAPTRRSRRWTSLEQRADGRYVGRREPGWEASRWRQPGLRDPPPGRRP